MALCGANATPQMPRHRRMQKGGKQRSKQARSLPIHRAAIQASTGTDEMFSMVNFSS